MSEGDSKDNEWGTLLEMKRAKARELLTDFEEYPKRAFCQAECPLQKFLQEDFILSCRPEVKKNIHKVVCKGSCIKSAWAFHDWLQKNAYMIVRLKDQEANKK